MHTILHDVPIAADPAAVFDAITSAEGLAAWWTKHASGTPVIGHEYALYFAPEYDWRAAVTLAERPRRFELELTVALPDWTGTRVTFELLPLGSDDSPETLLRFSHTGWPAADEHYRTSSYCWALYLRLLRRYVETGDTVPYEDRLDA